MLRAAFRNKVFKDTKDEDEDKQPTISKANHDQDGAIVEEESTTCHEFPMMFSKGSELDDSEVHMMAENTETEGPASVKEETSICNDSNANEEKVFPYTERDIYEMQLIQLQEQLVATIIQDQEKDEKLKKYEQLDVDKLLKQLNVEQQKNNELTEKLKVLKNKVQNTRLARSNANRSDPRKSNRNSKNFDADNQGEDWIEVSADMGEPSRQAPDRTETDSLTSSPTNKSSPCPVEEPQTDSVTCTSPSLAGPINAAKDQPDGTEPTQRHSKVQDFKKKAIEMVVDRLWDFVNEEAEEPAEDTEDGDALAVKTLKENINRFTNALKPFTNFIKSVTNIVQWTNPAASFITFVIYMYSARCGYLFSLLLLLMIFQLAMNYLYARDIAAHFGFRGQEKEEASNEDKSWSDKFQLVLQVARKVQNMLGKMANSLEKIKNLLTWQHPATNKLFINLCVAFAASVLLSGPTLFMFMALGFGIKMFITGPVYAKFPKVKQRYDGTARIWSELPTNADLAARQANGIPTTNAAGQSTADASTSHQASFQSSSQLQLQSWTNFCERMKIPLTEMPLPSCEEGRRCTLLNKDKPLYNMRNGRLFLTQNYLCFERTKSGSSKNIAIKLENITHVAKYKPIGIMPGTGMSIEVEFKGSDKPHIFGALLRRDELYESLILTGRAANLNWAG